MVTKKNMLSYAKSNGNEKEHAFLRQVKWKRKRTCFPTPSQMVTKKVCFIPPSQIVTQNYHAMLPQKIFKNHKIFEKKSQDLDSKSQVHKTKLLLTFTAKLRSVITSESTVMTFELHTLRKRKL